MIDYEITVDVSNVDTETKKRVQDAYFKLGFVWSNGSNGTKHNCLDKECYTNTFRQGLAPRGFLMWAGVPREPTHTVDQLFELAGMKTKSFDLQKALRGEPVVLRNGEKAYVRHMEQDVKSAHPLSGYTYKGAALNWTESGRYYESTDSVADIVGMWVEPPVFEHWGLLREDIKYLAKDRDNRWYGYGRKPTKGENEWDVPRFGGCYLLSSLNPTLFPECDWKHSLMERPEND